MNVLKGNIHKLTVSNNLTLVSTKVNNIEIFAIVIDTVNSAPYLQEGNAIDVLFKETEVIIGIGETNELSIRNQFIGKIESINSNELLSKLVIKTSVGYINSIITTHSLKRLNLEIGTLVTAMVKTNEIMLSE
ncbi:TOBE domain-containing protein [Lutibacter citreus]|uniref:TOBE domain-containing protein n=1 Tax=Lutibacter citreus TaxID=2138210 RepID=UPI000DBE2DB2|nr:TOBE domain-containing protein [Lutibacter citreus]